MKILGISCYYHESAAALIVDGKIIAAAEEERFTRIKHDAAFPVRAIDFCLSFGRIRPKDLDWVVFYEKPFTKFERNFRMSTVYAPRSGRFFVHAMQNAIAEKFWIKSKIAEELGVDASRILFVPQHLSHAAASYYPSPFERASILTLDAVGEWTTGMTGRATGNKIIPEFELRYPDSVGLLYSAFTAYLGFTVNDGEYKVMGMAAYGKPKYLDRVMRLYRQRKDGSIVLHPDYFAFPYSDTRMFTRNFSKLFKNTDTFDVAASIQKATENIILTMAKALYRRTGEENLVYGGGVALNSVVNAKLFTSSGYKNVFIFPAAGDDGGAVGCALYVYHHVLGNRKRHTLPDVFLSQQFSNDEIQTFLNKKNIRYKKMNDARLVGFITDRLMRGQVVGWFEGRAEFGPRALGHRSILADPKDAAMKEIVNGRIKFREEFRPFAPVILREHAVKYFPDAETNMSPYMLATWKASTRARKISPATVHVDGSSRIQTVDSKYLGRYRKLLMHFYKKTKRPILLNTSFNLKGEPIVNSPADAYRTFIKSGLDVLVMENFVILKK